MLKRHGAMLHDGERLAAHYSIAQDNEYFGWNDARQDNVRQLAQKFTERFPAIVDASQGDDWNYAGWYVRMLSYAEGGFFPIAYADWYGEEPDPRFLPLLGTRSNLPMPPPGDVENGGQL